MKSALTIIVVVLLAIPALYFATVLQTEGGVFLTGIAYLASLCVLSYFLIIRKLSKEQKRSPYVYFLIVCASATMVDFQLAACWSRLLDYPRFYFEKGEPYLNTSYGAALMYWDGIVHLGLYAFMLDHIIQKNTENRLLHCFWAGSIINSMFVLLGGAVIGFRSSIRPSFLLNMPFLFLPITYLFKVLNASKQSQQQGNSTPMSTTVYAVLLIALLACRGVAALDLSSSTAISTTWLRYFEPMLQDKSGFPLAQAAACLFVGIPVALMIVFKKSPVERENWSSVLAGAIFQGNCVLIMGGLTTEDVDKRPDDKFSFIFVNVLMMVFAMNLCVSCIKLNLHSLLDGREKLK